jgi:LPS sulfotransferase NodH
MTSPFPYVPFVVTALPRSGSFMLTTALDAHPRIRCHGETLSRWRPDLPSSVGSAAAILRHEVYTSESPFQAVGFKLLHQDAREGSLSDARPFLREQQVKALHLKRRNLLRQYLSFVVAEQSGVWILTSTERPPDPVVVDLDPEEMRRRLRCLEKQTLENEEDFRGCDALAVWYEDLVSDYDRQMARICRFLEVEWSACAPETKRQELRPLRAAIRNYDTIASELAGTAWESCLDEDDPRLNP